MNIDWKYQCRQYGAALVTAIPVFAALSLYIFYRRGYYDLYIANKAFAGDAAVLLGIVFLLGPLSRFFSVFDRYLQYRKEIGIVAFSWLSSIVWFLFFCHLNFLCRDIFRRLIGPSSLVWRAWEYCNTLFISNSWVENRLGTERWWWLQNWGLRLIFGLVVSHVFVMKMGGWIGWYKVGGGKELVHPEWPGAGLLVGWFMVFVVLIRLAEFGGRRFGRIVWYVSVLALPVVYLVTFWWGRRLMAWY